MKVTIEIDELSSRNDPEGTKNKMELSRTSDDDRHLVSIKTTTIFEQGVYDMREIRTAFTLLEEI